jgi:hypothetical protein
MNYRCITLLAVLFIGGCANRPIPTIDVRAPENNPRIENTAILTAQFEKTWNRLVKSLSREFFIINNIDKESRIISVSFSTAEVSKYVDCGTAEVDDLASGASKILHLAESQSFNVRSWLDVAWGYGYVVRSRSTNVEGRMNIYVAPKDNGTEISVNSRYIVNVDVKHRLTQPRDTGLSVFGLPHRESYHVTFNTGKRSNGRMICQSTGKLEAAVLRMAVSEK